MSQNNNGGSNLAGSVLQGCGCLAIGVFVLILVILI